MKTKTITTTALAFIIIFWVATIQQKYFSETKIWERELSKNETKIEDYTEKAEDLFEEINDLRDRNIKLEIALYWIEDLKAQNKEIELQDFIEVWEIFQSEAAILDSVVLNK